MNFAEEYARLSDAQKRAVDQIDGPLLVVAGPGTGKTQLLSARVAKILEETDTLAQSIVCLTFTEAAALNIRERLASFIGTDAYDVTISTYHAFGSEIIANYPDFFGAMRLERPIDDLGKRRLLENIIGDLPFSSTLKSTQYHIGDVMSTISELKRGLFTPESLRELSRKNIAEIEQLSPKIAKITDGIKSFPASLKTAAPLYAQLEEALRSTRNADSGLSAIALAELEVAQEEAASINKSTPLTKWKNRWLHKNSEGSFEFTDPRLSRKLDELATVLANYNKTLNERGLFDFDDMILRAIEGIESNPELKFNLQERYLYVLLDEFQDTNAAQFRLVQLLLDNPVNEGRPNVMAVGDDDQAIYAFQGAMSSNMIDFARSFTDTKIINLVDNYRSHKDILDTAHNVAAQIDSRLHTSLAGVEKSLQAQADIATSTVARHSFIGPNEEYAWTAAQIKKLLDNGVPHHEIAVLAPKHRLLEGLVPFLNEQKIPVSYDKRENILKTPIVLQLKLMAELLLSIERQDTAITNEFLPRVLSLEPFEISVPELWSINWQHAAQRDERSWAELATKNSSLKKHVWFFHALATQAATASLEDVLDVLIGSRPLNAAGVEEMISPLKSFYFSEKARDHNPLLYYETLSHLSVIREKLRDYQSSHDDQLQIGDFLAFVQLYESADQPLMNTHPVAQAAEAVNLMTAYKSKGLEFEHVFVLSAHDEVWGAKARANSNKLSLPANMQHIRHAGANEDERLRLLFVALTRAKRGLLLTSHTTSVSGKQTTPLKYLDEREHDGHVQAMVLPEKSRRVHITEQETTEAKQASIELGWHTPHVELSPPLTSLIQQRLEKYQMSPTHLNQFIDLEYAGPQSFLMNTILRFPQAPSPDGEYGNAVHQTLQWYQYRVNRDERPSIEEAQSQFAAFLGRRYLTEAQQELYEKRGREALQGYLTERSAMLQKGDQSEQSFRGEGVFVGDAHLTGLIDRLEINKKEKTIRIVDFKTGKPSQKWHANTKLLKYRQQLYMYKLLVEGSHSYTGYTVEDCRLEFVEPDDAGQIAAPLVLNVKKEELDQIRLLIEELWQRITQLDLPDVSGFAQTYGGSQQFIQSLIKH